tara:strand:- start:185 stop:319 length:135 start_codon:yes stop_codon:yes gene_type:complete
MGFLAVAGIMMLAFGASAMITQSGDEDDDDYGGGMMIPASVPSN